MLAAARRDGDAFARLYEFAAPRAFGLVVRILPDRAQAESALQDAFLEAARTADEFDPTAGSGRSWLLAIVHRHAVARRGDRSRTGAVGEFGDASVSGRRLARAFAALPVEQREALAGAYYAGLSETELAALTGTAIETVRATIRDGLSRVRSELGVLS